MTLEGIFAAFAVLGFAYLAYEYWSQAQERSANERESLRTGLLEARQEAIEARRALAEERVEGPRDVEYAAEDAAAQAWSSEKEAWAREAEEAEDAAEQMRADAEWAAGGWDPGLTDADGNHPWPHAFENVRPSGLYRGAKLVVTVDCYQCNLPRDHRLHLEASSEDKADAAKRLERYEARAGRSLE